MDVAYARAERGVVSGDAVSDRDEASRKSGGLDGLRYIPQLDGLRAIAVVLVMIYHWIEPTFFGGNEGVDVFFVLSGYLITTILMAEHDRASGLAYRRFYIRRFIRLYPPLLLVIAVMLVPGLLLSPAPMAFVLETVAAALYLTPVSQFVIGDAIVWYHTWTLGLEEYFYLVWPASMSVILTSRKLRRHWPVLGIALGVLLYLGKIGLAADGYHFGAYLRIGGLVMGSAVAVLLRMSDRRYSPKLLPLGAALAILAVVVGSVEFLNPLGYLLAAVGTCLMLPGLTRESTPLICRALAVRPMAYIGSISYELYLWHYPLLVLGCWANGHTNIYNSWWAAPGAFVAAALSHRILAPVSKRLKDRVPY